MKRFLKKGLAGCAKKHPAGENFGGEI